MTTPEGTPGSLPYQQDSAAVLAAHHTEADRGLRQDEASARLARDGSNELTAEPPVPAWRRLLAQFQNVLVVLLLVATAISAGLWLYEGDTVLPYEALAIGVIVLLNAGIGFVQEARAESAVAALRQMAAAHAQVIRDGEPRRVLASEVVAGDILVIEEGDTVPADARIIQSTALQVAEATLTGESVPVAKEAAALAGEVALGDRANMIFGGTTATYGRGRAVVVATGMRTEMGRIAGMLRQVRDDATPLQKELDRVGRVLGMAVVVIAVVMIATILLTEDVTGLSAVFTVLILGVALAVAAVPEGMPTVVTAVLAIGVQRMARKHAIVRHLHAVETLGSAAVIASDKTGTLTRNEMTVQTVVTASGRVTIGGTGYAPLGEVVLDGDQAPDSPLRRELQRALTVADRANNAVLQERDGRWTVLGDPTEGALVAAARKAGLKGDELGRRFARVGEIPFSSSRKLMSTVHTDADRSGQRILFTKGAADVLLPHCTHQLVGDTSQPLSDAGRAQVLKANDELGGRALRTLGVAYRRLPAGEGAPEGIGEQAEEALVFAGLIGMIDPPRDEVRAAVVRAKRAGIRPLMITGDHPATAGVIAVALGIAGNGRAVSGAELDRTTDAALEVLVRDVSVYARVTSEHKLRIVTALQQQGAIVAMTGDGVNDAPALKRADIGVAMGITGTDVSKEAADLVLANDDFASIVEAVAEGRAIYSNIRKFLRYLLSSNIGEVMTMFAGVLLAKAIGLRTDAESLVLPLLATQLLWINLVTDGAPALALGLEPSDPGLMERPPRARDEPVITRGMWGAVVAVGAIMAAGTLFVLDASLPEGFVEGTGERRHAQTMAFTTLMLFQLFNVFNARSDERSAFTRLFTNRWLWLSVALSLVLHVAVVYAPFLQDAFSTTALDARDWVLCGTVASSVLWLSEIGKVVLRWARLSHVDKVGTSFLGEVRCAGYPLGF
jgi:P-type Ca2+ transporter type 2C